MKIHTNRGPRRGLIAARIPALLALAAVLVAACATGPADTDLPPGDPDVYVGAGRGDSLGTAMNAAKMDAVRRAVIDIIGAQAEQANSDLLQDVLYSTNNPNAYVRNETMETTRRENLGTIDEMDMVYEIRIRVNRESIENVLRAQGLLGGGAVAGGGDATPPATDDRPPRTDPDRVEVQEGDFEAATEEEARFIRRYVDTMTYLVYYEEDTVDDMSLFDRAVTQANSFLINEGLTVLDLEQVKSLDDDQRLVYEEETGESVTPLQWIAQELNADVYIEIEGTTSSESRDGNYYATAEITLKLYETSTGQLLGSIPYRSQRTLSRVDAYDAQLNAVQSAVWSAMGFAVEQAQSQMSLQFERGIRYEVTVQNTPDSRLMSDFRRRLRNRVSDVETEAQSAEETRFVIYFYGRVDELEDTIYDVADTVPGMEGIYQVLTRGKSITFNSGL